MIKSKISEETKRIIAKYSCEVPVRIVSLCNALGIKVYTVDWNNNHTSGMIKRGEDGNFAIYVNVAHREERRRFTVAHELAHFILHKDYIGDGISEDALYRSGLQTWMEIEANQLAASILMPLREVEKYKKDPDYNDVESIAKKFRVSKQAMAIRLGIPN